MEWQVIIDIELLAAEFVCAAPCNVWRSGLRYSNSRAEKVYRVCTLFWLLQVRRVEYAVRTGEKETSADFWRRWRVLVRFSTPFLVAHLLKTNFLKIYVKTNKNLNFTLRTRTMSKKKSLVQHESFRTASPILTFYAACHTILVTQSFFHWGGKIAWRAKERLRRRLAPIYWSNTGPSLTVIDFFLNLWVNFLHDRFCSSLRISFKDFQSNFTRLEICMMSPDSLLDDGKKSWKSRRETGRWQKGVTAGGCRNFIETFHINPQFR